MSVVPASLTALIRYRKALESAFNNADWAQLQLQDQRMGACLNAAFEDPQRDTRALVVEMEKVLRLYASIVSKLPSTPQSAHLNSSFSLSRLPLND